jgi:hypothetical protein
LRDSHSGTVPADKIRKTTPRHFIVKMLSTQSNKRILNAIREKKQVTHKGKLISITTDFSTETLKEGGHGMMYVKH